MNHTINDLYLTLESFYTDNYTTIIYPNFNFNIFPEFIKKINLFNNLIIQEQIKTIEESINMVKNKNLYFKKLIIDIFMENNSIENINSFKNILFTRIKKCIQFLRTYNISINQIKL
jgi:hypothetical protein